VFSVGGLHPPLVTRPPPGKPYFPECYVNTCAFVELRNCTLLCMEEWVHLGIVLSWDGIYVSWFLVEFMR
jgi:hypothetical protein